MTDPFRSQRRMTFWFSTIVIGLNVAILVELYYMGKLLWLLALLTNDLGNQVHKLQNLGVV